MRPALRADPDNVPTVDWLAAAVGGVPGLAALGWNVYSWERSGPDVRVTASFSMPVFGDQLGDPHIQVTASNRGRMAVTITAWGIGLPSERSMAVLQPLPWSTPLPHRLEPHSEAQFYVPLTEVQQVRRDAGCTYKQMRPYVTLATGERPSTRGIPVDESWTS